MRPTMADTTKVVNLDETDLSVAPCAGQILEAKPPATPSTRFSAAVLDAVPSGH